LKSDCLSLERKISIDHVSHEDKNSLPVDVLIPFRRHS
jgi:hypothetical protein